jgi:folate-binding protein YgfZ
MRVPNCTELTDRGVLSIAGEDARTFLQGLISNDVRKVSASRAVYSALLTAQGKYLHDFFLLARNGELLLDCEKARAADLLKRLGMYRLRSKVNLANSGERYRILACYGDGAAERFGLASTSGQADVFADGVAYVDPRLASLGVRVLLPRDAGLDSIARLGFAAADLEVYDRHRLTEGVPDGSRDLIVDKSILLENGFDELNGIDWDKGCYIGQELTARTKYRGLIKKRLMPVSVDGPLPAPGTPIALGDDEAGEMRSGLDGQGLALLRLEAIDKAAAAAQPLTAAGAAIRPVKPGWAKF